MIRIAFLGADSTHVDAFAKLINSPDAPFSDCAKVVSLWGTDRNQVEMKAKVGGIERPCNTIDEALEGVDLVMVTGRFGNTHFEPALQSLNRGIPVFVDKPMTCSLSEMLELERIAKDKNVLMMSASPLRFCSEVQQLKEILKKDEFAPVVVSAPATCTDLSGDDRFHSPFFYGIHGVEILLELCPELDFRTSISSIESNSFYTIHVGERAKLNLVYGVEEFYSIEVFGKTQTHQRTIKLDGSYYRTELSFILKDFYNDRSGISLESTRTAIQLLEGIESSRRWRP